MLTANEVAAELGVPISRVHRAARGGLAGSSVDPEGRLRLDAEALTELRRRWGAIPSVRDLSREAAMGIA